MINSADRIPRETFRVVGKDLSAAVTGQGPTVILLHGNATYSYMWRNVIPFLAGTNRCVAPDLPGMGRSEVIFPSGPGSYSFDEVATYVALLIELVEPEGPVVLVGHELGATIAVQYARRNPGHVAQLILVEGVFRVANDERFEADVQKLLHDLRGEPGEVRVLMENAVVEEYLPRLTSRRLPPAEMDAYRAPYLTAGESRRATLSLIRQLPLRSSPGPLDELVQEIRLWCAQSRISKLIIGGNPGFLVPPSILGTAARWANTEVRSVPGVHYLLEDSPARVTSMILDSLASIGHMRSR